MKTALITGATSGIGLELAKIHAQNGGNLVLVSRNLQKLTEIKTELEQQFGVSVFVLAADLEKENSAQEIFNELKINNIKIDFLLNNAGLGDFGNFIERGIEKCRQMIALNISALMELTYIFANEMVRNGGGKILNVASIASVQPVPNMAVYGATKAFVLSFSQALGYELRKTGVSVTALMPGPTSTNFFAHADGINSRMTDMNMPADKVAAIGYLTMLKGRRSVIAGLGNRVMCFFSRVIPVCNFSLKIASRITEMKK
ncbi:MAG: SDR family oxidoreductase [Prevotellaceae bacterium]|jgi:short-subunit dehydrogenase|nr:SDR family oxidoreductase [Prevotellaceae bacterium]